MTTAETQKKFSKPYFYQPQQLGTGKVLKQQHFSPKYSALTLHSCKLENTLSAKQTLSSAHKPEPKKLPPSSFFFLMTNNVSTTPPNRESNNKGKEQNNKTSRVPEQQEVHEKDHGNLFSRLSHKLYNWVYPLQYTEIQPSTPLSKNKPKVRSSSSHKNSALKQKRVMSNTSQQHASTNKKPRRFSNNSLQSSSTARSSSRSSSRTSSANSVNEVPQQVKRNRDHQQLKTKLNNSPLMAKSLGDLSKQFQWGSDSTAISTEKINTTIDVKPEQQYGTAFYVNRKKMATHQDPSSNSNEVSYLREMFHNSDEVNAPRESEKLKQLDLLQKDSAKQKTLKTTILNLISDIKKELERKNKIKTSSANDDVIFVRSAKVYQPIELTHREKLVLDRTFFDEEFKTYKKILAEREALKKALIEEKQKKKLIPSFTKDELRIVNDIFYDRYRGQDPVSKPYQLEITKRDFKTLTPGRWLNDTVIEFYMKHIEADNSETVCFNSFFFTALSERGYQGVRRWMKRKKADIFQLHKIFVPINLNQNHWVLGMVDIKNKKIVYADSLCSSSSMNKRVFSILKLLQNYVIEESGGKIGKDFKLEPVSCPQQPNGFDCGVFVFMNSLYLSKGLPLTFEADESTNMRKYVGKLILDCDGIK